MTKAANDNDATMIVTLTAGQLRALIREEVALAVEKIAQVKPPSVSERWVDVAGAAAHFKCSPQTIRNWIAKGAPARSFGPAQHPMLRIDLTEFEAWVDRPRTVTGEVNG